MIRRECTLANPFTHARDRDEPGVGWVHHYTEVVEENLNKAAGVVIVNIRCLCCGLVWESWGEDPRY